MDQPQLLQAVENMLHVSSREWLARKGRARRRQKVQGLDRRFVVSDSKLPLQEDVATAAETSGTILAHRP